jgi:hypothetical protein
VRAVAIRDEQVLTSSQQGVFDYLCDDGEVILKNTTIANVYHTSEDLALQNFCNRCDEEIEVLQTAQAVAGQLLLTDSITSEINEAAGAIVDSVSHKNLDSLQAQRKRLQLLLSKKLVASGKQSDFSERIRELRAEKAEAQAQLSQAPASITSGLSGYFCSITDGYETLLPGDPSEMTAQDIRGMLDGTTKALTYSNAVGKVQKDFRWNLVLLADKDHADSFVVGASVTLNFGVSDATAIPATVSDVREEDGETIVTLRCEYLNQYLIRVRVASIDVQFKSYTGLRIHKDAIRYIGQTEGVYVKSGNSVTFKPIERIYEDETYVLCSDSSNLENGLEQFDEVIVKGTDLYDGKILG